MTDWLLERYADFDHALAIAWKDSEISYKAFTEKVREWSAALRAHQVQSGQSIAIVGDYSPNTCALIQALIGNANICVPLSPKNKANCDEYMSMSEVQGVFDFSADDSWTFRPRQATIQQDLLNKLRQSSSPGLIVFSTGSTGKSKAIVHDFNKVLGKFVRPRKAKRTLCFLMLDHFGGINTLFSILSSGGTVVSIAERSPDAICQAIERQRVQILPTSPTFLNMLMMSGVLDKYDLSSLELITYGTEPMLPTTLGRVRELFPKVDLKQTYGLSEVGVLATQSREPGSLWLKAGGKGFETKVIDGILWIRSESSMLGYLNAPSPFDANGWFNTEDEVEVDGEYLRILGRKTEIINVGGEKVYPAEVESILLEVDNIKEAIVRGRSSPVTGSIVTASITLIKPEDEVAARARILNHCRRRLERYKVPVMVEFTDKESHGERFKKIRRQVGN